VLLLVVAQQQQTAQQQVAQVRRICALCMAKWPIGNVSHHPSQTIRFSISTTPHPLKGGEYNILSSLV
jgi:hypothetical protein